jgi:hypothetical protein
MSCTDQHEHRIASCNSTFELTLNKTQVLRVGKRAYNKGNTVVL